MCQVIHQASVSSITPTSPIDVHLDQQPPSTASSQLTFPSTLNSFQLQQDDHNHQDIPIGPLFQRLQIWFDQEGFREIAPIFHFSFYNPHQHLLYFTTDQVGYPFHYTSLQHLPVLRKVVAPDYEEAYHIFEGKSCRNAGGRRDFLSRQASLDMKLPGKYMVQGNEGKFKNSIWRLIYQVEDRKSLMGRPMPGERSFLPITFACSPEVLDPLHARKTTLMNVVKKTLGSKTSAIPLDHKGRPKPRPRGKSLIGQLRCRSDSTTRLIPSPPSTRPSPTSHSPSSEPLPLSLTSESNATSGDTPSGNGNELSRAQEHSYRSILSASSGPSRPATALGEENRKTIRRFKTSENLRRPITADPILPPLPSRPRPFITPLFGNAPQPTRETPITVTTRSGYRPKTSETHHLRPPKDRLDIQRIAAASLFASVD